MDFKLLFSGGKDIPADVRMIYGGLIKRHQKLKNGWSAVLLRNNMAYLYKNNAQPIRSEEHTSELQSRLP